jgi:hexosaminidase
MQIKNQQMMIRKVANNNDVDALTNFLNVVEPVKDYNRSRLRLDYTSFSLLTRVVDAAVPDAETARNFSHGVDDFLSNT